MRFLVLLAVLAVCCSVASAEWVVCYFSSWAVYRPGVGKFDVDDIDPYACTHLVFGFAGLSNQTWSIEVLDPWNENCPEDDPPGGMCAYQRFVALKELNPQLKVILAVGGWNEGSEDYSNMVADPAKRRSFIDSSLALVQKEGFDGLDIDWEYPTQRGGVEADREGFIRLLDEFRVEFDKYGLLMTAALASGKPTVDPAYDVPGLVRNLDIFSIMTYDYHGAWENFTHHNAPLCGYPGDEGDLIYFNVVFSINYWLELGIPAEKTVMGIPLYGRCFTLDDINEHGMLADAQKPGLPGPYTRLPGTQGWNEICERIKDTSDCTVVNDDPFLHEPYMYCKSDLLWCGYDDSDSVYLKARFAKSKNLAGAMVWTIDTDDFFPTCSSRKFNLISTIKDAFAAAANSDEDVTECPIYTTPRPTTTSTPTTTTTPEPTTTTTTTTTPEPTTTTTTTPEPTTTTTTTPEPTTTTTTTPEPTTTTTTTPEPTTTTTTTPEPTTTTTTTTPEPTTTSTTTQEPTTTRRTTPEITTTKKPTWPSKPDCLEDPDRYFYPHDDCNKYWWCVDGDAILMLCSPGTYFNPNTNTCDHAENVDTSNCREWVCQADGELFAGAECNEYYECEHGQPTQKFCADGLYFNPEILQCDRPENVDTNTCNVPARKSSKKHFKSHFKRRYYHDEEEDD